jgi:hypothetical protein
MIMKRLGLISAIVISLILFGFFSCENGDGVTPEELIKNGDFETGNLNNWDVQVTGGDHIYTDSDVTNDYSWNVTAGPKSGNWYAAFGQDDPGESALSQEFTVPAAFNTVTLTFDMFADTYGPVNITDTFDNIGAQFLRVDILLDTASTWSLEESDIVLNVFEGADDQASNPNDYTAYEEDLTSLLTAGESYILRFAAGIRESWLDVGIDNVSIYVE